MNTEIKLDNSVIGFRVVKIRHNQILNFEAVKLLSNSAVKTLINRLKLFGDFQKDEDLILLDLLDDEQQIIQDLNLNKAQYNYLKSKFKFKADNS